MRLQLVGDIYKITWFQSVEFLGQGQRQQQRHANDDNEDFAVVLKLSSTVDAVQPDRDEVTNQNNIRKARAQADVDEHHG